MDGLQVPIAILDAQDMPAMGDKTLLNVFGKGHLGWPIQRDIIGIIQGDKPAQAKVSGQGSGLHGHAFHDATVPQQRIGHVVDNLVTRAIEGCGQELLGHGHSYGIGEPLPQGAGGCFNPGRKMRLGVAWRQALPLAKTLEFGHGETVSGEM
jgi:hypothetical protein